MTDHYAVIGNPVEHSKSPQIHAHFAEQTGQDLEYSRLWAPLDGFAHVAGEFFSGGGKGLNVTVPFKEEAYRFSTHLTDRATRAGAVNTLRADPDGTLGDNTDGAGLVRDLRRNLGVEIAGKCVLVVGAGGAARGILPALLDEAPAAVAVANRTAEKAYRLAEAMPSITGYGFDTLPATRFDLIINGTATGLSGSALPLPEGLADRNTACYDLVYADRPTVFMEWAAARNAGLVSDGLGMLVEQAAESFFIWRGIRPETKPVLDSLRSANR